MRSTCALRAPFSFCCLDPPIQHLPSVPVQTSLEEALAAPIAHQPTESNLDCPYEVEVHHKSSLASAGTAVGALCGHAARGPPPPGAAASFCRRSSLPACFSE
jgi:hypothetical protein